MSSRVMIETLPDIECACATVRRAARLVTQVYDEEFAGRLEASQFALLSALEQQPGCNQSTLARALGLDKTTLSRNLSVLAGKGWIERQTSTDQRERGVRLTPAGRELLKTVSFAWRRAQTRLPSAMTTEQWDQMWKAVRILTNASQQALNKGGNAL